MSLESQESTPLEGLESCQRSFTECELIVLDETGSQSEKEDDIVFEKEVRGVCSTNLSPAGSRTIDAATVMIDELGDDEIELICISSQESLDGNSKQERLNNKEEPEREEIAISEESNSFSSHLHRKESFEPDKTGNEERICIFTLPKPEIVIEQGSSSTKIEETYIEKSQSTKSEELQIPSDFFCLNTKPESSTHKKLGLRFRRVC